MAKSVLLMEGDDVYQVDVIADDNLWLYVGKLMQNEKASDTDPRFPDAVELSCGVQRRQSVFSS
jgi:hypothetical protein